MGVAEGSLCHSRVYGNPVIVSSTFFIKSGKDNL